MLGQRPLLGADARPLANPLAPKPTHFPAKAKNIIFLFMAGGPSQLELFDYKPKLNELNGQPIPHKVVFEDADCAGSPGVRCAQWRECLNGHAYISQHLAASIQGRLDYDRANWPPADSFSGAYLPNAQLYMRDQNKDWPDFVVPEGQLLVMGDNRDNSTDGRFFGLVPLATVKGKAGVRWFAFEDSAWWAPTLSRMFELVHDDTDDGTCSRW